MKVIIESISIGQAKSGVSKKSGKEYTFYPIGIKVQGEYHNCNIFDNDIEAFRQLKNGSEIDVELFKEHYQGKDYNKFKLIKQGKSTSGSSEDMQFIKAELKSIKDLISCISDKLNVDEMMSHNPTNDLPI